MVPAKPRSLERYRDEILYAIKHNQVNILTSPTGTGKSTFVTELAVEMGYRVVETQPRRLAAMSLPHWISRMHNLELGTVYGYRTGFERLDSPHTRGHFVTHGLQLVKEMLRQTRNRTFLIPDEVHEWDLPVETLVAWTRRELQRNSKLKVMLMSATMDTKGLSAFFGDAPVLDFPGEMYPVSVEKPQGSLVDDVDRLLRQGRNVLVFLPGKREIREVRSALLEREVWAEILPLHSLLSPAEQERCFQHYDRPKCVLATNIAQTSITIDDIDAVVDSGLVRLIRVVNGVEGLHTDWISLADETQRMGRAGRTKPGIYISHCRLPLSERLNYPEPEINRRLLAGSALRIKSHTGLDMEGLTFFHQPKESEIVEAKRCLRALGCFNKRNSVTTIGQKIAYLPVSVQLGRLIVEGTHLGVREDCIKIASIIEAGGITCRDNLRWMKRFCQDELAKKNAMRSDVLAQLAVYEGAVPMCEAGQYQELEDLGVNLKQLTRAMEIHAKIKDISKNEELPMVHRLRRTALIEAILVGFIDHIFFRCEGGWRNGDCVRQLTSGSVVSEDAKYLVGLPFDLSTETDEPPKHLIRLATHVQQNQVPDCIRKQFTEADNARRQREQARHKDKDNSRGYYRPHGVRRSRR